MIKELLKEYFAKKAEVDKSTEELEQIKAKIKLYMEENDQTYFEDEDENLIVYKEQTRNNLNKKLLVEKFGEDALKDVYKSTTFSPLRIMSKEDRNKYKG